MISAKNIIDKTNQFIGNPTITDLQFTQLSAVDVFLANSSITVTAAVGLPAAADYIGVPIYVTSEQRYYFSDGVVWRKDFTSDYEAQNTILYGFGRNNFSQLGDNTVSNRSSPVTVVGGIATWKQTVGSLFHTVGVTSTGIAYAWGSGNYGRLGDNTTSTRSSPVTVVGGITNWTQIGAGRDHTLGLTSTGLIYAWGYNNNGQLGDNTTSNRSSPVSVVGGITNWSQIAGGIRHNLALTSTGFAYAWGYNGKGNLGDGTLRNSSSPVIVVGGITNWTTIGSVPGGNHSLATTLTGIAYAWGENSQGQLGDNTTSARSSPVIVVGGITNWSQLVGGALHSLGATSAGIVYGWGNNGSGQLGDNTITSRTSPVTVVGGITNWSQVSAGQSHSLGLRSSGIAYAWGLNDYGQLGDNTITSRRSPVTVVGGITNWSSVSAGYRQSHAISTIVQVTKGFV